MKKFLSLLLAGLLLACPILGSAAFSDVPENHWAHYAISYMEENFFANGYGDGTFLPNQTMTRAEFAKLFKFTYEKAHGTFSLDRFMETLPTPKVYADVPTSHWANFFIDCTRYFMNDYEENGILNFHPDEAITREEAASALGKSLFGYMPRDGYYFVFKDTLLKDEDKINPDFLEGVRNATTWGLVQGYQDGTFCPQKTLTRAEAVTMLYRYICVPTQKQLTPEELLPLDVKMFPVSGLLRNIDKGKEITGIQALTNFIYPNTYRTPEESALLAEYIENKITPEYFENNYLFACFASAGELERIQYDTSSASFLLTLNADDFSPNTALFLIELPKSKTDAKIFYEGCIRFKINGELMEIPVDVRPPILFSSFIPSGLPFSSQTVAKEIKSAEDITQFVEEHSGLESQYYWINNRFISPTATSPLTGSELLKEIRDTWATPEMLEDYYVFAITSKTKSKLASVSPIIEDNKLILDLSFDGTNESISFVLIEKNSIKDPFQKVAVRITKNGGSLLEYPVK